MTPTRIICAQDAAKLAETLVRLFAAEGRMARLCVGRASLEELEAARCTPEAVVLVWSPYASVTQFMDEWMRAIEPKRLVEIVCGAECPRLPKRAPPVDFSRWRGARGGHGERAWAALNDRLRAVGRALDPPKPSPMRAAIAMGVVSIAAVGGAAIVRVNDGLAPRQALGAAADADEETIAFDYRAPAGVGGALEAIEPASLTEDDIIAPRLGARTQPMPPLALQPLAGPIAYEEPEIRDPTLIERIVALNPLNNTN